MFGASMSCATSMRRVSDASSDLSRKNPLLLGSLLKATRHLWKGALGRMHTRRPINGVAVSNIIAFVLAQYSARKRTSQFSGGNMPAYSTIVEFGDVGQSGVVCSECSSSGGALACASSVWTVGDNFILVRAGGDGRAALVLLRADGVGDDGGTTASSGGDGSVKLTLLRTGEVGDSGGTTSVGGTATAAGGRAIAAGGVLSGDGVAPVRTSCTTDVRTSVSIRVSGRPWFICVE